MSQPQIRLYTPEDYTNLVEMWLDAGLKLSLSDTEQEIRLFFEDNPHSFFVMEDGGKIIGSVIAAFDGRRGYIHHLAVHPDHQKRGWGRVLMERAEAFYRQKGVVKIHLMIERSNAEVVDFYKNLNWHVRDDLIMMSKSLRTDQSYKILGKSPQDGYVSYG